MTTHERFTSESANDRSADAAAPADDEIEVITQAGGAHGKQAQDTLANIVGSKENRKVRARQDASHSVWFGFGMFGVIGWSVTVPALACVALGVWIDSRWPSPYSWTLMLLFIGVILGCLNAWYWVSRERGKLDI